MVIKRFEIYWVNLDPTVGREMQKTRPAVVVSPNEVNNALGTILVAPITLSRRNFPTRIAFELNENENYIALDQIRAVDKIRLIPFSVRNYAIKSPTNFSLLNRFGIQQTKVCWTLAAETFFFLMPIF